MSNCYAVCGANFENTVGMVSGARGLDPQEVKQILREIREKHSNEREYLELRKTLPEDFEV